MTPLFPAQRAAEEFDSAVNGTASPEVADRHAALLATVGALRAQPEVQPRPDFSAALRVRLMAAAETDLVPAPPTARPAARPVPVSRVRVRQRRLGTLAASLVIVGGTAGMAAAASGALPGDSLYSVKRGGEQVTTALRLGEASRGKALLGQAENRLSEVQDLAAGGASPALVADTVEAFRVAADGGADKLFTSYQASGDTADITAVREFTASQMSLVGQVAADSDPRTAASLVDAADTLADIDQQARVLCGGCGSPTTVQPPAALSAGAAAASVDNLLARPVTQAKADARAHHLAVLQARAEQAAGRIPQIDLSQQPAGSTAGSPAGQPVASTVTQGGQLLPALTGGSTAPVKNLVTGVTSTLTGVTGQVKTGVPLVDDTVDGLTDTVDDTLQGVTGSLLP